MSNKTFEKYKTLAKQLKGGEGIRTKEFSHFHTHAYTHTFCSF